MSMINSANIVTSARGQFKVQVIDSKTGVVVKDTPWRKNLILNSGMNIIATYVWADAMRWASAGTGTDANYEDSGAGTAACDASGNVTFTSYTLSASREGAIILWDTGEQGRIVSGSGSSCVVTPAPGGTGIADGAFTLFRAERTTLVTPRVGAYGYTGTCLANYPNTFSSLAGNILTLRRTFEFPAEGSSVTYGEVGVHPVNGNGATCFSRMTIPGTISLVTDQQLRLIYQLILTIAPVNAVQTGTMSVSGWPVSPATTTNVKWALWGVGMSSVLSTGATNPFGMDTQGLANEPSICSATWPLWISPNRAGYASWSWPTATAHAHAGYSTSTITGWPKLVNYTSSGLVYSVEKQLKVGTTIGNYDTWGYIKAMGQGYYDPGNSHYPNSYMVGWTLEFDEDQKKTDIQNLALGMKFSWSRELSMD